MRLDEVTKFDRRTTSTQQTLVPEIRRGSCGFWQRKSTGFDGRDQGGTAPARSGEDWGESLGQPAQTAAVRTSISLRFTATRNQIFKAFPAIANLADRSDGGEITIQVEGTSAKGFDAAWLRNAVEESPDRFTSASSSGSQ